jgi:hypothetical protein
MTDIHERCVCSSIREISIFVSEAINIEKICEVCFWPTEEEIQYTSHLCSVLLLAHSCVDHKCLYYLAQHDHRR